MIISCSSHSSGCSSKDIRALSDIKCILINAVFLYQMKYAAIYQFIYIRRYP
jgi:hypothetical protein